MISLDFLSSDKGQEIQNQQENMLQELADAEVVING